MEQQKTYTRRQRLENWFHYNKLWVFAVLVILWVAGSMVWNLLGIGRNEPDFRILYVGSRQLPEDCVQALEQALADLAEDCNGDGTVTVSLTQCVRANGSIESQMYGYGSEITVLADITEAESHFFLLEDPVDFQLSFQILGNLDGSIPAGDDFEALNKVFRWADCPVLASLELGTYEDSYLDITEAGEIQELLQNLYLGRRYFHDPAQQKYPEADNRFWQAITEGAAP